MELLPPTGWADVATKHDLAHQTQLMNARFDQMAADTNARFAKVDSQFEAVHLRFDAQAQHFDGRLATEISGVRIEIADLRTELHRSLRINMLVTVGVLGTLISAVGILTGGG